MPNYMENLMKSFNIHENIIGSIDHFKVFVCVLNQ